MPTNDKPRGGNSAEHRQDTTRGNSADHRQDTAAHDRNAARRVEHDADKARRVEHDADKARREAERAAEKARREQVEADRAASEAAGETLITGGVVTTGNVAQGAPSQPTAPGTGAMPAEDGRDA